MSSLGSPNPLLFGAAKDYEIERSLRLAAESSACYHRTWSGDDANLQKQTYSFWIKRTTIDTAHYMFTAWNNSNTDRIGFTSDNQFFIELKNGGSTEAEFHSDRIFRDPSSWMHIVVAFDTTDGTTDNRMKAYINNELITDWDTKDTIGSSYSMEGFGRANKQHVIGAYASSNTDRSSFFDGYMADFYFIDGQQLTPSSFGETNEKTGQWVPIKYTGTYGSKGWYINFSDNSDTTELGRDSSGNSQDFTPDNISVAAGIGNDSVTDTPTNNFPVLNPLNNDPYVSNSYTPGTISNGNLQFTSNSTSLSNYAESSIYFPTSGKWYVEVIANNVNIASSGYAEINMAGYYLWWYYSSPYYQLTTDGGAQTIGAISNDDVIQVAYDVDSGKIWYGKNNTWYLSGNPSDGTAMSPAQVASNSDGSVKLHLKGRSGGATNVLYVNFGQQGFTYTPPTGFKALCTKNLPIPTIKKGSDYFDIKTYTGTGSSHAITGLSFQPDLVYSWRRNGSGQDGLFVDSVRGGSKSLGSNSTAADNSNANRNMTFQSNGVTWTSDSGHVNASGGTYVNWYWKESASAGFDIVSWTGSDGGGSNTKNIPHSLGAVPDLVIIKNRSSTYDWAVKYKGQGSGDIVYLNAYAQEDGATGTNNGIVADLSSASHFTLTRTSNSGNWNLVDKDGDSFIAYVFSGIEGYSKFGKFEGNGDTDGPFVFTGFRPSFIITKKYDGIGHWYIWDTERQPNNEPERKVLWANYNSEDEGDHTAYAIDFLSNGFKVRNDQTDTNTSGSNHLYIAFAERPFKYANAR